MELHVIYGIKCTMNLHVAAYLPADARPTYITVNIICIFHSN